MSKTLGLDPGTNSIGISLRNDEKGKNIIEQLEYFSSIIFKSGVGEKKGVEFSYAAERTKKRTTRRLYQARKYRIWATLKLLIENGYCPLSMSDLERWSKYDKEKGLKRQYPTDAVEFERWVRLDFNGDGVADYSSPYELRAELMTKQFDFSQETDRYKLGRALYHIAQRRGFKSSKGETIKEQEKNESIDINNETDDRDTTNELKKSEEKKSGKLTSYMEEHNLPTIGCAFYHLEKSGIRVRNSEYQAVRSQYKEEITQIFNFQKGLDIHSDFYKHITSEKKGDGSIFYKRPLRSQKGLVGKCTLEPDKPRCPISHPEFEKFRAWCFINNIRFGADLKETLTLEQKKKLYKERFLLTRKSFKFEDIRNWISKETGKSFEYSQNQKTINCKDNTTVFGCPISGRLKNLLGEDWETWEFRSGETKIDKRSGEIKDITYTANDLWHICFSFDDPEFVESFATGKLGYDKDKAKQLTLIYGDIQQGYGMLSLKAIKNINRFLEKGLIYSDAVLLAKLPDIFKEKWEDAEAETIAELDKLIIKCRHIKQIRQIANTLISNYKSLSIDDQFAYKDTKYTLQDSDFRDIEKTVSSTIGENTWAKKTNVEKKEITRQVAELYQTFFSSSKRDYYELPKIANVLANYISSKYDFIDKKDLKKIYHPSMIDVYPKAKDSKVGDRHLTLLGSPVIGALKNPMAMRVLHTLRKQINALLKATDEYGNAMIDENTRIVVETARELNDANMRWAIDAYQREREKENKEFEKIIKEHYSNRIISDDDIDEARILCDQHDIPDINETDSKGKKGKEREKKDYQFKKDVTKYKLWLEQGCRCIYTGKPINITNLFSDNAFDIEHTIPRSISFDDSLANLTICDAHYNRTVKKNQIPSQLANYEEIKQRLQPWFEKVQQLKENVEYWKVQSKRAQTKDRKDYCIQQKHLWQMELDYWQDKVNRFTMTEVTDGFRNSQLVDTRIITKYIYHYLKTVFNKVEVQKGSVTANFRKILGIQSIDEKKSRDKHSHHAIDATVLSLVPTAAKRDKMIELFYKIQEKKKMGENTSYLEDELKEEIKSCNIGDKVSDIVPFIENNILINHVSKDQTLTPSHKRKRIRGKIVPKRDENGLILYELNEDGSFKLNKSGHKIPQAKEWISGDCIRGQLHKESFFGAIKYPKTNTEGYPITENGQFVYGKDSNGGEPITMVKRELITSFKKESELDKIIDPQTRSRIKDIVREQMAQGVSFDKAITDPIWLCDKNGKEIKQDKNGRPVLPIRHVRCKVAAGRGVFTKDKAIEVKKQTYLSKREYKNMYYAQNDENYLCLLYEGTKKGKTERRFRFINYFEIASIGIKNLNELQNEPYFNKIEEKNVTLNLSAIIKKGTKVIMWDKTPKEIESISTNFLNQRMYIVYKFNLKGANCIYLQNHIEARAEISKEEDFTVYNPNIYQARLTLVANGFNCLIENKDFTINELGNINLL